MTFSYDLSANVGKVRLLIADARDEGHIFEDEEIAAFLALNIDSVRLAAADALETMASNESMVQKKVRLLDVQTDGPAVAADLRKAAATLRAQALVVVDEPVDPVFATAEYPVGVFAEQEYRWNQLERQSI